MTADPARTELILHDDPRLFAAVGAIVTHAAQRAGLSGQAQDELTAAAIDTCRGTFALLNGRDPTLKLVVTDYSDRVEVIVEYPGEASARETAKALGGALQNTRVDRAHYETSEGRSRMILIKYCSGRKEVSKE